MDCAVPAASCTGPSSAALCWPAQCAPGSKSLPQWLLPAAILTNQLSSGRGCDYWIAENLLQAIKMPSQFGIVLHTPVRDDDTLQVREQYAADHYEISYAQYHHYTPG